MIAKPEWFTPRKFGWGLGIKKIEGWIYVGVAIVLITAAAMAPVPENLRFAPIAIVFGLLLADILSVMRAVYSNLDEREQKHQLVAERNAALTAIACLIGLIFYNVATAKLAGTEPSQDAIIYPVTVLLAMSLAKGLTLLKIERDG